MPKGLWKQITLTYNPWVNNHWTKERFWDKEDPYADRWTTTHHINEWLDEEDHDKIERLKDTDPDRYKVVGLGEYGIPGGAYFDEFRRDIHTCDSFVLPDHWRRYFAMDYGLDMLAGYWVAVDTVGKAYIYKEVYQSNLIISDAAQEIKRINGKDKIYQWLAPPDLWNRRQETGRSAMEIFTENGVPIGKANNNRVQGWLDLKEWLKPYKDEYGDTTADLVIFRNCTNLIRCLPQVQCDDRDPNDVSTEPHELTHSIDAIRYFVSGRPAPTAVAKVKSKSNFWTQTNDDQGGLMEW
jgi:phage terminase large subunit